MPTLDEILQDIVNTAAEQTEQKLGNQISSLTRMTENEIQELLSIGITKKDLARVIKECKDATKSNQNKNEAISKINGGINAIIQLVSKFI
ncbi:MAG: hypothetical protein ACC656_06025 [Candidatus Heimdallarchaeota archaeon]